MSFEIAAVPFEIPNVQFGFKKVTGLLKHEGGKLLLEFQVVNAFFPSSRSEVKEVAVSVDSLEDVRVKKGLIRSSIILEADSLKVFEEIPATEQAECELQIKRGDREKAEKLVSHIRLSLSEKKLRDLENE